MVLKEKKKYTVFSAKLLDIISELLGEKMSTVKYGTFEVEVYNFCPTIGARIVKIVSAFKQTLLLFPIGHTNTDPAPHSRYWFSQCCCCWAGWDAQRNRSML